MFSKSSTSIGRGKGHIEWSGTLRMAVVLHKRKTNLFLCLERAISFILWIGTVKSESIVRRIPVEPSNVKILTLFQLCLLSFVLRSQSGQKKNWPWESPVTKVSLSDKWTSIWPLMTTSGWSGRLWPEILFARVHWIYNSWTKCCLVDLRCNYYSRVRSKCRQLQVWP